MPWMVYTIVFLVTDTPLYIVRYARDYVIEDTTYYGVGNLIALQKYVCK